MDTRRLMEQLLQSGSELLGGTATGGTSGQPSSGRQGDLSQFLGGAGGGALAGGALGLLLGNKKARKVGKKVALYGGLAALGVVAYKAYGNWQQNQSAAPSAPPQTVDRVSGTEAELHSHAILRALIGAAKADGHIDARERQLIDDAIGRINPDPALNRWFDQELQKPLDPAEIAASAKSPEMAAEMYLASLLVVDEESYMEKAYLQELARQLNLDAGLVQELETQAALARPGMTG